MEKQEGAARQSRWWLEWPWRQIQTNLREIDMQDIDAKRYVAELQAFKATVAMINTSGIIASYPTKLPYHFQSPYLTGDSLEDIIAACHEAGIKVIARTDFSKVRRPIFEQYPEWAYISNQGKVVDYNGDIHVCVNSDYQQKYALNIIQETLATLDIDGIFFNMGGYQVSDYSGNYYGICQCQSCQSKFDKMFGLPLPKVEDMQDPVYRKYRVFKGETLKNDDERMYHFIQQLRPDIIISNNSMQRSMFRQESNTAVKRSLPHWQYSASDNTKYVVSSYPGMISSNTTVDFIDFPYRHVAVSPWQQKLRLAQNLANGGGIDYYLIGRLDNHEDKSGYKGIKEIFHYHAENAQEYKGLHSKANIALLNGAGGDQQEYQGWFRFLVENHFLFDTIMTDTAEEISWEKYDTLILPNFRYLSDALCSRVDQFAADGGTVVVVSESGFYHENYEQRGKVPFQSLGIDTIKTVRTDMTSSYFKLDHKEQFPGFPETELIFMDGAYVYADYQQQAEKYCRLIPPHHFGPPERCYYTQITEHPAFTINAYGKGRAVYIPWEPGKLFHRQGYANTIDFAADLLENAAGVQRLRGNLSPMVEVTLFQKEDGSGQLLHLVNGSGHFGVSFYEPITMNEVLLHMPCTTPPVSVSSLVRGCEYSYRVEGQHLIIEIPKLELFDAVKIV